MIKSFGIYNYFKMIIGKSSMQTRALKLPKIYSQADGLPLHFLTGKKYLYQTLYCIQSLVKVSSEKFKFILIDDGTFDERLINQISEQLPDAEIITQQIINKNLASLLPLDQFPMLHQKRKEYPHIKKLTDVHTISSGWKVVLDSDMLFWNSPDQLLEWLKSPNTNIYMIDCEQAYGYSTELMRDLCGNEIPDLVNVGIIGLQSSSIDWPKIENWCKTMEEREGKSYFLEQAITAMIVSGSIATVLQSQNYVVNPSAQQVEDESGILHHYVHLSKADYFRSGWRKIKS